MHECMHVCMYICLHACMYACMHACNILKYLRIYVSLIPILIDPFWNGPIKSLEHFIFFNFNMAPVCVLGVTHALPFSHGCSITRGCVGAALWMAGRKKILGKRPCMVPMRKPAMATAHVSNTAAVGAEAPAAVGASGVASRDMSTCVVAEILGASAQGAAGPEADAHQRGGLGGGRAPRFWFMGKRIAVNEGQQDRARDALRDAYARSADWDPQVWRATQAKVLAPFRSGITKGGNRSQGPEPKRARASPMPVAAVGAETGVKPAGAESATDVATAALGCSAGIVKPGAVRSSSGSSSSKSSSSAGASPSVCPSPVVVAPEAVCSAALVSADAGHGLRDKLILIPPFFMVGRGSFGRVYKCSAKPKGKSGSAVGDESVVAVKVLQKLKDADTPSLQCDISKAVQREIAALITLCGQKEILQLMSWTETTFDVQLVFSWYPEDVHAAIVRGLFNEKMDLEDSMPYMCRQLVDGLTYMHRVQIIHRDIKPRNMLLAAVGAATEWRVVIADLGSSIKMSAPPGLPSEMVDSDGTEVCTYQYRAPELCGKGKACSYASDVWSLGVSIVEMDMGRTPFGRDARRRCELAQVLSDALDSLSSTRRKEFDFSRFQKEPTALSNYLAKLQVKAAHELPWGRRRGLDFQKFTRQFFGIKPSARPLAREIDRPVRGRWRET